MVMPNMPAAASAENRSGPAGMTRGRQLVDTRNSSFLVWYTSQCKNNCLAEMWSGPEEGSYVRPTDFCITQP